MESPVPGVGDPNQGAGLGAGYLHIESGGLVLTGVELGVIGLGPALKEGAVDDQLAGGIAVLHSRNAAFQSVGDQGCVGGDDP